MNLGFIGAGNMAAALTGGWGDPVLCTDAGSGHAQALAGELGGEALRSNRELAERADLMILAHKPAQLAEVASPGGTTARGLAALERGGVRAAFASAMDDVVGA
jgi:pyrroline-5-carboxylate reductase